MYLRYGFTKLAHIKKAYNDQIDIFYVIFSNNYIFIILVGVSTKIRILPLKVIGCFIISGLYIIILSNSLKKNHDTQNAIYKQDGLGRLNLLFLYVISCPIQQSRFLLILFLIYLIFRIGKSQALAYASVCFTLTDLEL